MINRREKALRNGVVPTIAFPAHGLNNTKLLASVAELLRRVLASAVRMEDKPWLNITSPESHSQGVVNQRRPHMALDRPAYNHSAI